jgi:uncharacterized protein (UPF0218 family)
LVYDGGVGDVVVYVVMRNQINSSKSKLDAKMKRNKQKRKQQEINND